MLTSFSLRRYGWLLGSGMLAWFACVSTGQARVDESQPQLEAHLLADGTAARISEPVSQMTPAETTSSTGSATGGGATRGGRRGFGGGGFGGGFGGGGGGGFGGGGFGGRGEGFDMGPIDDLLWLASGESKPAPTRGSTPPRPPGFPEYLYYKSDDGSPAETRLKSAPNISGWELHVYMYKQVSVLEVYHRLGTTLADPEITALLEVNRGNSTWTNASGVGSSDTDSTSFLGFDAERADGLVRSLHVGNDLVIFSTGLDKRLAELKQQQIKARNDRAQATTPTSTHGF